MLCWDPGSGDGMCPPPSVDEGPPRRQGKGWDQKVLWVHIPSSTTWVFISNGVQYFFITEPSFF